MPFARESARLPIGNISRILSSASTKNYQIFRSHWFEYDLLHEFYAKNSEATEVLSPGHNAREGDESPDRMQSRYCSQQSIDRFLLINKHYADSNVGCSCSVLQMTGQGQDCQGGCGGRTCARMWQSAANTLGMCPVTSIIVSTRIAF